MNETTILADHQKYLCAEDGGGEPGKLNAASQPEGLLTASRESAGGWETFLPEWNDDGTLSLRSKDKQKLLCAENATEDHKHGRDGILVFNRDTAGGWEKFIPRFLDNNKVALEIHDRPGWFMKAWPDGRVSVSQPYADGQPTDQPGGYESFLFDPPLRSISGGAAYPLEGQMHTQGLAFCDNSGPRVYVICHFMEAFSLFCREEQTCVTQLQEIAKVYPGIRFCDTLGYYDYWRGREVNPHDFTAQEGYHVPATHDYWGKLKRFYQVLKDLKLKAHHSRGDLQMFGSRDRIREHIAAVCRLIRDNGFQDCVELMEICNETVFNGVETPEDARYLAEAVYAELPGTLVCHGAPGGTEEPDLLRAWAEGADVGSVHGMRPGEFHDVLRHIFSCRREGFEENTVVIQGEPFGPGDDVSGTRHDGDPLGRSDDVEFLCAAAIISTITGQRWCYMSGYGVRWNGPIESQPGFAEVARAVAGCERDVFNWETTRGGSNNNPFKSPSGYYGDEGVSHGPARIDGSESGGRFAVLVNAGKPPYEIEACWNLDYEVLNPATMEVERSGHLNAGERITLDYRIGRLVRSPFDASKALSLEPELTLRAPEPVELAQSKSEDIEVIGFTPPARRRVTRKGRLIR